MNKHHPLAVSIAATLLLSSCGGDQPSTLTSTVEDSSMVARTDPPNVDPVSVFEPRLSPWQCPDGTPTSAHCHRIELPADWDDPDAGDTVSLPIIVIPPTGPDRRLDAIVVPAGGPGGSSTAAAAYWWDPYRDTVLYDQRGAGSSVPSLECPERNRAWLANLQRVDSFEVERASIVDAYAACRNRLEAAGVDLDDYDTEASVHDLEAIRVALGYPEWNILGASYGSRLALAAMRSTPDGIRSVILDSVYDVTAGILAATRSAAERAFAELAIGCSQNAACATAHPDLTSEIDRVAQRYNDSPVAVDVDLGDGPRTFLITGDDIMAGLFYALYDPALIPVLPSLIGNLAAGDTAILGELVRRGAALQDTIAWAMYESVNCSDNAGLDPSADREAIIDPGRFRLLLTEPLCDEWPVEPTSDTFNSPVVSDIPALVVAGRYDPVTPPAGTRAVADRLVNSTYALWLDRGHGVTGEPCANEVMTAFIDNPTSPVNLDCLASVLDPAFG